jgi:hypothetical protein
MGELQPDQQAFIGTGDSAVFLNQGFAQIRKTGLGMRCNEQLVRVRASLVGNRDYLTSPDQLRAAAAEFPPATNCSLARSPVWRGVPTFHGLHGNPVSDFHATARQSPSQG